MNARSSRLVSFLFEFIPAPVVVPVNIAVVIALLKFLVPLVAVILVIAAVAVSDVAGVASFVDPETLHKRSIGEFKLAIGDLGKLTLDRVVMNDFFMPVVIG